MESSNAGSDISSVNTEKSDQLSMSPVPDLVTNVPDSTANANVSSKTIAATATDTASIPDKSGSPQSNKKASPGPVEEPVDVKSTPIPVVKAASSPSQLPSTPTLPRATSLPSAASEASVKNRSTREEKSRKKDDKSVDHVLRALNSLNTTEEKLAAMCKKYADIFDEHRKLQLLYKQMDKKCSLLQREKELLQADHSKAILTRSRLENLCRELQRQNKAIKDESLLKIREEEEKRKEVSAKFQATMNEITTLMQQNNDNNMKLRDDNIDMTSKLKSICEQYEVRQQQVERISKQMQLEQQLAEAKLSKLKMEMGTEREVLLKEKQQLLLELQQYQQRCKEFQNTEVNLRSQISMYNDKYDEFQKALARSNDVFGGFKGEMEKMSKKICKLEKETSSWKLRWERSHNALLEMAADKQRSEQELSVVSRQLVTLQGLCRTLQTERASLMAKLRGLQAVGGVETVDKSVPEKCTKQCEQALHCLEQSAVHMNPSINHLEQPTNHIIKNDPVLVQYNQDILASFKEAVEAEDACNSESVPTECAKTSTQVPTSPLPDVVGVVSTCISEKKPDVNSVLCERLEGASLNPSEVGIKENRSADENTSALSSPNAKTNGSLENNSLTNEASTNQQPTTVESPASQIIVNGEALTNGLPQAPLLQDQITPTQESPKSPVKGSPSKCTDSGKKTKESSKKKKK